MFSVLLRLRPLAHSVVRINGLECPCATLDFNDIPGRCLHENSFTLILANNSWKLEKAKQQQQKKNKQTKKLKIIISCVFVSYLDFTFFMAGEPTS